MMLKIGLISICAALVTGCGVKKFECPYNDGVHCKSLSEVNDMVNRGEYGKRLVKKKSKIKEKFFNEKPLALNSTLSMSGGTKQPLRVPEKIIRIWLAPYESQDGIFHQETVIYTVARPAHWVEG